MATAIVHWDPRRLNAKLVSAYGQSIQDARLLALARSPSPTKARVRLTRRGTTTALLGTAGPLGHIFELGREGGYVIQPGLKVSRRGRVRAGSGNLAIKFTKGDGGFARGGIKGGAMKAEPYIGPSATLWAQRLYQMRARAALISFVRGS